MKEIKKIALQSVVLAMDELRKNIAECENPDSEFVDRNVQNMATLAVAFAAIAKA
jgi:hypothetical protein